MRTSRAAGYRQEQMAAVDFSAGAMVACYPRENEANALALDGQQPAEGLHVTLIYLGSAREAMPMIELVQAVAGGIASETEALAGTVGGIAQFEDTGEGAPLVLLPDVPGLTELGTSLREELARIGVESPSEHGFQPHLTVSYGADPATAQDRLGAELHFDTLSVVIGNDRFDYPLQSPPQTLISAADHPGASLPSGGRMAREAAIAETDELAHLALRARGLEGNEAILAALTAAGVEDSVEVQTVYDLAMGSAGERCFYAEVIAAGFSETRRAEWPSEAELGDHGEVLYRADDEGVFRLPNGVIAHMRIGHGWFKSRIAAPTRSEGAELVAEFSQTYPPLYAAADTGTVPITFWTNGQWGPVSRLRRIEASSWETITGNYAGEVREELSRIVGDEFSPGAEGQLLLWQGPPGTGKTWALRALASEWGDWAEFHYITDPDAFFVSNPSYMIDVLLSDSYEELTVEQELLTSTSAEGKWKVLILEDTGELLSANAKEAYGQGLSRLLNVVDGMVGQGLRVLAVVTTNDELGDMHPAATRPGRCASQIVFAPLSAAEASEWLGEQVEEGGTLAELYARRGGAERAFEEETAEEAITAGSMLARASERLPGGLRLTAAVDVVTNASQLRWRGPLLVEGKSTDDGRMIEVGAIDWRELPLSLMAMLETGPGGHEGAQLAGRIDRIWRDGDLVMGEGVFDDGEFGAEVARLVDQRMLRGVSVDLAIRSFEYRPLNEDGTIGEAGDDPLDLLLGEVPMVYVVTDASIGMATVCPFPAFADAEIALVASAPLTWRVTSQNAMVITECEAPASDSPSSEGEAEGPRVVTASAAGLAPVVPPADWFADPGLDEPTPLQITDEGRIFGHAAVWDVCHIGFEDACVLAPRSETDYRLFHLGEVEVELPPVDDPNAEQIDGRGKIACGQITLGTGHAALRLSREAAVEHYDDSGTVAAHVVAGEDAHGIWFAGALSPDLPEERVRELRAAKISGDWRRFGGNLELVAMLAVNVPGFPVPRVKVNQADGEPLAAALVAAGVADQRLLDAAKERKDADTEIAELAAEAEGTEDLIERARAEVPADRPFRGTLAEAALATLATAHSRTVEAVEQVLADGGNGEQAERELAVARQALGVLETFAAREQPRPGDIHVHVPEREVNVAAPNVTVEAPAPAEVHVNSPQIDVHVPEQPAPQVLVAAPEVRVEVEAPKPRAVRVEVDDDGTRRYVPEEAA